MPGALSASAFIASALVLVPLPWHWRARNIPTLSIIAWLFLCNLTYGVNAIIWAGNVDIVLPVWCDIVTKIKIGATMGLPACCLCMALQLYAIASSLKPPKRSRAGLVVDLMLCCGLPIIIMALHYIVQGHRFDIVEDFGCRPAMYISVLSLLLVDLPPGIASFLALIYCGLVLFFFFRRRLAFTRMLTNANSALTTSRYIRLMSMTVVLGTWNAIIIGIGIWATYGDGLRPWTSWSDVHFNFSRIQPYPLFEIPRGILAWTYFLWAAVPISSLLFFSFFAFGEDATKEYGHLITWIRRNILRQRIPRSPGSDSSHSVSMYASSLGATPDGLLDSPSRQPSQLVGLFPHLNLQHYADSSRTLSSYSADTSTSDVAVMPLQRNATPEKFYQQHEFWAM
ncbi:pheromone A receptor-domain-containing protein [Mycena epipterygia]|nr:pheromone A receptor-domain-containing protein [Mycena epipterygia]